MTGQEQDMLNDLVHKINSTSLQEKDDDAERLLRDGLGRNPDALYMLAQTVLVQNIALDQARQQMMAMQQQAQHQPAKATSFLGSLFGHHDPQQPSGQSGPPAQAPYQPVQYAQQAPYAQQAQPVYQQAPGSQPSFLRSAATTAAGVAAGALAFEGVESMLHGGFGGGGFGGGGFGGGYGEAPREEVVNNYYDTPGGNQNDPNMGSGPDEQPQGPFDASGDSGYDNSGQDSGNYGDDFTDGGGDFGGDDDTNFS